MESSHKFDLDLRRFQEALEKDSHELTSMVDEKRRLEDEVKTWERNIETNKHRIESLKPKIRELESNKIKHHNEIQKIEMSNRAEINEHLTDPHKMIRPLHH